jgi:hypothetical protein
MAQAHDMTFEEINRIVEAADLRTFDRPRATAAGAAAAPGDILQQLCAIWKIVGPIVHAVAKLPILPPKWRDALQKFADLLDGICRG